MRSFESSPVEWILLKGSLASGGQRNMQRKPWPSCRDALTAMLMPPFDLARR